MKNDPEDIRQTAAGDPHHAGTEPDGGCGGGRGIPELCLSAGTGQICAEHHGGAAAGKEGGVGYHALRLRRPGGSPCGNREEG